MKVFVRGEYIKTKTDRVVFLTEEVAQQLTSWLTYKYRKRRVCYNRNSEQDVNKKKTVTEYRIPDKKENDLIFAIYQNKKIPNPDGIYDDIAKSFARTLADIQTKVEELEELNRSLRQRDKIKDGAIAHLSDQLVSLSARLQEIEREQQV